MFLFEIGVGYIYKMLYVFNGFLNIYEINILVYEIRF